MQFCGDVILSPKMDAKTINANKNTRSVMNKVQSAANKAAKVVAFEQRQAVALAA